MTSLNNTGAYVQPFRNFDVDEQQLRIALIDQHSKTANAINLKDTAIYQTIEIVNNQTFFNVNNPQQPRIAYRKCFILPSIATNASTTINHGITGFTTFTRIYGTCSTDAPDFRPIPYAATTSTNNIEINVTATQIYVANGSTSPNIVDGIIVLEYLKQ